MLCRRRLRLCVVQLLSTAWHAPAYSRDMRQQRHRLQLSRSSLTLIGLLARPGLWRPVPTSIAKRETTDLMPEARILLVNWRRSAGCGRQRTEAQSRICLGRTGGSCSVARPVMSYIGFIRNPALNADMSATVPQESKPLPRASRLELAPSIATVQTCR